MKKYRLKDSARRESFRIVFPDFEEAIQKKCEYQWSDTTSFINLSCNCDYQTGRGVGMNIPKKDIEAFEEYDPTRWNKFPDVTPPEDELMRVETNGGGMYCAMFNNGRWLDTDGIGIFVGVVRYRPWVSPDEEE